MVRNKTHQLQKLGAEADQQAVREKKTGGGKWSETTMAKC